MTGQAVCKPKHCAGLERQDPVPQNANRDWRIESSSMKLMSWARKRLVAPPLAMSGVRFGRGLCPV